MGSVNISLSESLYHPLTVVKIVVLQQAKDAQGQQEYTPHVEVVALAPHRSGIGQRDQNATCFNIKHQTELAWLAFYWGIWFKDQLPLIFDISAALSRLVSPPESNN